MHLNFRDSVSNHKVQNLLCNYDQHKLFIEDSKGAIEDKMVILKAGGESILPEG